MQSLRSLAATRSLSTPAIMAHRLGVDLESYQILVDTIKSQTIQSLTNNIYIMALQNQGTFLIAELRVGIASDHPTATFIALFINQHSYAETVMAIRSFCTDVINRTYPTGFNVDLYEATRLAYNSDDTIEIVADQDPQMFIGGISVQNIDVLLELADRIEATYQ